jgi:hypothetical protein
MLANAFNFLINLHSRSVTIERPGDEETEIKAVSIRITPANYFRNLSAPEEIVVEGKEFLVSKEALNSVSFPMPKRGDILDDSETGTSTISEVREVYDFGGTIMGYRLRTS